MSGGRFSYDQYKLGYIADEIEQEIEKSGRKKSKEDLKEEYTYRDSKWYDTYPEDLYYYSYPEEILQKFKEGVQLLRIAEIYVQRIDYLLSGDDGEESFLERLKEDLTKTK